MTKLYKLTDKDGRTMNNCQWGEGVESPHGTKSGEGPLCTGHYYHAYTDPLLAVLCNPCNADITNPLLWEAEGDVAKAEYGPKVGCTRLRTIRQIPSPEMSPAASIRWTILWALEVCNDVEYVAWAHGWLSGEHRSLEAARTVGRRTWEAWPPLTTKAAARRAAAAMAEAATADAMAIAMGTDAAWEEAEAATWRAEAAMRHAEVWLAETGNSIDFAGLARRAVEEEAAMEIAP